MTDPMKTNSRLNDTAQARTHQRVEALYRKYGSLIFSRCRSMLRDDALAEDATQEVFMRVMKNLSSVSDDQMLLPWISRISTNYCLNLIRGRSRQAVSVAELPEVVGDDPEPRLIDHNLAVQLVSRVPQKLQAPVVLYFNGCEQAQIATTLGVSRRTVVNRLSDFLEGSRKFLSADLQAA